MNDHMNKKQAPLTLQEVEQILEALEMKKLANEMEINPQEKGETPYEEIMQQMKWARKEIEHIFEHVKNSKTLPLKEIEREIIPIIKRAAEIPHIYHLFSQLITKDEYTYQHAIGVGIIATLIGKWLKLPSEKLNTLTLGATLHDIGKVNITQEILNKPSPLTKDEFEEMKRHTIYGYEILKRTNELDEVIPIIALQHHEQEDGNGYPIGLIGSQINELVKIVTIADVFHSMTSERMYQKAVPFYKVIKQMERDAYRKFDPYIFLTFLNKMMNLLVGKEVILTDRRKGVVIMIHPYDPLRCLIQLEEGYVDLRYEPHLQIEKVLG